MKSTGSIGEGSHPPTRGGSRRRAHRGLSLLEVILAIVILGAAMTMIGALSRLGFRQARQSRDLTRAALLCESKLSEITSGVSATGAVSRTPFPDDAGWLYSVEIEQAEVQSMQKLKVTVERDAPASDHPIQFTLVEWIIDPSVLQAIKEKADEIKSETEAKANAASSNSGSSTSSGASTSPGTSGAGQSGSGGR